jgi:hypothetical protein
VIHCRYPYLDHILAFDVDTSFGKRRMRHPISGLGLSMTMARDGGRFLGNDRSQEPIDGPRRMLGG